MSHGDAGIVKIHSRVRRSGSANGGDRLAVRGGTGSVSGRRRTLRLLVGRKLSVDVVDTGRVCGRGCLVSLRPKKPGRTCTSNVHSVESPSHVSKP